MTSDDPSQVKERLFVDARDSILELQKYAIGQLGVGDSQFAFEVLNGLRDMLQLHLTSTKLLLQHIENGHFQTQLASMAEWLDTLPDTPECSEP